MSIAEFCRKHSACADGMHWALDNCVSMEDAWGKLKPEWMIWVATRKGVLTDRELRLFAVSCARSVEHLMTDERSREALRVSERYANGDATKADLAAASAAASAAAKAAAKAARGAAWGVIGASRAAVRAVAATAWAVSAAVWAVSDAASATAWAARAASANARETTWAVMAVMDTQAQWLRQNTKPNFK